MLTLFVYPGGYGLPSVSPFCTKTMVYMRLAKVEHQVKPGNPRATPNGKLPCLRHEGGMVPDSGLIKAWLREHRGVDMDADLSEAQHAQGHLIRRTLEEHLYWVLVYSRWVDEAGWKHQLPVVRPMLPAPVRAFLPGILRSGVKKSLHAHGLGRHPAEKIYAAGVADIEALERCVQGPFLFGDTLSSYDIELYAFAGAFMANPATNPVTERLKGCDKLLRLFEGVAARYEQS